MFTTKMMKSATILMTLATVGLGANIVQAEEGVKEKAVTLSVVSVQADKDYHTELEGGGPVTVEELEDYFGLDSLTNKKVTKKEVNTVNLADFIKETKKESEKLARSTDDTQTKQVKEESKEIERKLIIEDKEVTTATSNVEVNTENKEEVSTEEVSTEEVSTEEVSTEEGNTEEVSTEEGNTEEEVEINTDILGGKEINTGYTMKVQATMYSRHQKGLTNFTTVGYDLKETPNIIAVNPDVIPYGSVIEIEGFGEYIAGDKGSNVSWGGDFETGIAIHTDSVKEVSSFGKQVLNIKVYPKGKVIDEEVVQERKAEEARLKAEEEARLQAEEEARLKAEEEARLQAEEEARLQAEEEARLQAEEEARLQAEEESRLQAERLEVERVEAEAREQEAQRQTQVQTQSTNNTTQSNTSSKSTVSTPTNTGNSTTGGVISVAEQYLGTPYVSGGRTPSGFDCSGFTQYVYKQAYGVDIGGWTGTQQYAGTVISVADAQPGDLYFWGTPGGNTSHVAIATGGGNYIHSPRPGKSVEYLKTAWFTPNFAVRVNK